MPQLFPIGYELSLCKDGRFNIETLWARRILTPKRPIATMCYWLGLCSTVRVQHFKLRVPELPHFGAGLALDHATHGGVELFAKAA